MIIRRWRNQPLVFKSVLTVFITGLVVWFVLDTLQARHLNEILLQELSARLAEENHIARVRLSDAIERYRKLTGLFTENYRVREHFNNLPQLQTPVRHNNWPEWLPPPSSWRGLIRPTHIVVFDGQGNIREIFDLANQPFPNSFMARKELAMRKSLGVSFATSIAKAPYILTAGTVSDAGGEPSGTLLLMTHIDDRFLRSVGREGQIKGVAVALITGSGQFQRVLASSDPNRIAKGTLISFLEDEYLLAGRGHFDYGDWDLRIKLTTFMSRNLVVEINDNIMDLGRDQRLVAALVYVTVFILLMVLLSHRIGKLSNLVETFWRKELLSVPPKLEQKDKITALEHRFKDLAQEVAASRQLMRSHHELETRTRQLETLQAVTEELGVGVLRLSGSGPVAINDQMDLFIRECGNVDQFLYSTSHNHRIQTRDSRGLSRIFDVIHLNQLAEDEVILVQDVTELVNSTAALEHQALHDMLTGLPNRTLLMDRLQQVIQIAHRNGSHVALMLIDLDRFKDINDTLGHLAGDKVLKKFAQRIIVLLRETDTLARLGGDEFALLLPGTSITGARLIAKKLAQALVPPMHIEEQDMDINASIGMVQYPTHGGDVEQLLRHADVAMYHAKRTQSGHSVYDPDTDAYTSGRLSLMVDLRTATEKDEIILYFQPQVDLSNMRVTGAEALIRWQHPVHGLLPPDRFIPLIEMTASIGQITRWALNEAIHCCARWQSNGRNLDIAINLSARNLHDPKLVPFAKHRLAAHGLNPALLTLELTETAIMHDPATSQLALDAASLLGVMVAMDDFGTGYSSLSHLRQLPVSKLKIDKSFVSQMQKNEDDAIIVRSTVDLAHNLGISVIAEGVESESQLDYLRQILCDSAQGYYFAKPMPYDEFNRWLDWFEGQATLGEKPKKRKGKRKVIGG